MKRNYGLFTAITMITGIVIGSGIFFKADDVLAYANYNVLLGVLVFVIAAIAVVFGALTISQLAIRTDKPGGLVSYAEDFVGTGTATAFGWFESFLYLPTLGAVVAWASGIYVSNLLGFEDFSIWRNTVIGLIALTFFYAVNILSAKLGGWFQNASMIIKLIPLIVLAVVGLAKGGTGAVVGAAATTFGMDAKSSLAWLGAFGPLAFSFDGWIVSTSICHEIKNSKKNLPLALSVAPIFVLVVYLAYFLGITSFLGVDTVREVGDNAVYLASSTLFGDTVSKLVLVAVVISILGTVNGVSLGLIRLPYSLALRNMMPASKVFKKENKKLGGMPVNSGLLVYALSVVYLFINYFVMTSDAQLHFFGRDVPLCNLDISSIAICVLYLTYIILYVAVIKLWKKGEIKNTFLGLICPILGTIGSLIIFSGSVVDPVFFIYALICIIFIGIAYLYYNKNKAKIVVESDQAYHTRTDTEE
ncbi:MAG: APC family permease [Clostridia bacterium]|nr:APC family permease [Clostridia bacterium]